jgi:hypothetical protein
LRARLAKSDALCSRLIRGVELQTKEKKKNDKVALDGVGLRLPPWMREHDGSWQGSAKSGHDDGAG